MHVLIEIILLCGAVLLLVPVLFLLAQVVAAVWPVKRSPQPALRRPRIAVLMPAHDESAGIAATLEMLLPQLNEGDRCLVVADNCTDDTAFVAGTAGAEVIERTDLELRGKGYALDYGVRALAADPPEVLVVVDADCSLSDGALGQIAALGHARNRPVQAMYVMKSPKSASGMALITEFAGRVKNLARPLGSDRMNLPCPLMGTGMAIPWRLLDAVKLATGHIVEDAMLSIDFTRIGLAPLICEDAFVITTLPANTTGARSQRTRWEHGNLAMITGILPRELLAGLKRRDLKQAGLALDLLIPPLALFVLMVVAFLALCAIAALLGAAWSPLVVMTFATACLLVTIGLAWLRYGRDIVPLTTLLLVPFYIVRKIPLYLKFLTHRQTEWVRSKRDAG